MGLIKFIAKFLAVGAFFILALALVGWMIKKKIHDRREQHRQRNLLPPLQDWVTDAALTQPSRVAVAAGPHRFAAGGGGGKSWQPVAVWNQLW
jgi:hypothetical protein